MSLVVEDGGGQSDAESYLSVDDTDSYHLNQGNSVWASAASVTIKEQCLRRATSYIDKRFGQRFVGYRNSGGQALQWPRREAYAPDGWVYDDIPRQIKAAVAEYALRALIYNVLAPDAPRLNGEQDLSAGTGEPSSSEALGAIKAKRTKVGPIEKEVAYETASQLAKNVGDPFGRDVGSAMVNATSIPEYPEADLLIEPLLQSSGGTLTMFRS